MLTPGTTPLSAELYRAVVESCPRRERPAPLHLEPLPTPPPDQLRDLPANPLPEGQAYA